MILDNASGVARAGQLECGIAAGSRAHEDQVRIQFWRQLHPLDDEAYVAAWRVADANRRDQSVPGRCSPNCQLCVHMGQLTFAVSSPKPSFGSQARSLPPSGIRSMTTARRSHPFGLLHQCTA